MNTKYIRIAYVILFAFASIKSYSQGVEKIEATGVNRLNIEKYVRVK